MQLILLDKVRNLGSLGDEVKVRSGYGRNFLIPRGKAVIATKTNRAEFEGRRAELEKAQTDALDRSRARGQAIEGLTLQVACKASDEGRLFGSVGVRDICDAAKAAGFEITRGEVHLSEGPLKTVGDHAVSVVLHPEVSVSLTVSVVAEKA